MSDPSSTPANSIVRKKQLASELGVSDTTLWRMRDELPAAVQISKGIKGWRRADINSWLETRSVPR